MTEGMGRDDDGGQFDWAGFWRALGEVHSFTALQLYSFTNFAVFMH
jgi:hypothetical protein